MNVSPHTFSIPVMGTGHSIDSPIRVAHYGIDSVISIVDDLLVERIRKHYCQQAGLPYKNIPRSAEDGRARRITAYLDLVGRLVRKNFELLKSQPFFEENDKATYFEMLPGSSKLRQMYDRLMSSDAGPVRDSLACELTRLMRPGSIDVNIMAKVDGMNHRKDGTPMSSEYSDASAALRGYAHSGLRSSLVLSAGFNPRLYNYLEEFSDFYRDRAGEIKKRIILKVSDFRSALIQGMYLAKKGLEVYEYRIESGLNCGGHAFPSDGHLLPSLLREFREKRGQLISKVRPLVESWYENNAGKCDNLRVSTWDPSWKHTEPRLTVQGGIGTAGEARRLMEAYGMDATGWGSPFLLVPEATTVDRPTRRLLEEAGEKELYLSGVSPLGVPFNNVRGTGSEAWHRERIEKDKPGSPCPKGFLESNTEFTENPICTASTQYQLLKLNQIAEAEMDEDRKASLREEVLSKACLCDHLGNGALIALDILEEHRAPQAICPGPNIAWFDRRYSLREMVDHIYGRGESLVPPERPHMFAKEMVMYVDYAEERITQWEDARVAQDLVDAGEAGAPASPDGSEGERKKLLGFLSNLHSGIDYCEELAEGPSFGVENLASIPEVADRQRKRLRELSHRLEVEPATA